MTWLQLGDLACCRACYDKLVAAPYPHADVPETNTILIGADKVHVVKDLPPVIYNFILLIRDNRS